MYTVLVLLISILAFGVRIAALGSVLRPTFDLFCLFFLMLVFIPFGIIIDHLQQDSYLPYIDRFKTAMFPTPEPFLISLLFFSVFFLSYVLIVRRNKPTFERVDTDPNHNLFLVYIAAILSLIYLFIGMFINGFPMLRLADIGDQRLRDIAFTYASNNDVALLFSQQVFGTVFRIVLPFLAFILFLEKKWAWGIALLAIAALFAFGTLKRMHMIYIILSVLVFITSANGLRLDRRVIVGLLVCVLFGSSMTYFYNSDNFIRGVLSRIFIVEAISEYAVYSYYFVENSPAYFELFTEKIRKILDRDVITFSQSWKAQIATNENVRGYAAVGIFAELYLSFWYFGVLLVPLFAYLVERIDRSLAAGQLLAFNAIASVVVAAMAVKGFPSQFFTGGLMVLLMAQIALLLGSQFIRQVQRVDSSST